MTEMVGSRLGRKQRNSAKPLPEKKRRRTKTVLQTSSVALWPPASFRRICQHISKEPQSRSQPLRCLGISILGLAGPQKLQSCCGMRANNKMSYKTGSRTCKTSDVALSNGYVLKLTKSVCMHERAHTSKHQPRMQYACTRHAQKEELPGREGKPGTLTNVWLVIFMRPTFSQGPSQQ